MQGSRFVVPAPALPDGTGGASGNPAGAPSGGALGTYAVNPSAQFRQERYRLRGFLWLESRWPRVRACGRCRQKGVDRVLVRASEAGLGLSGLQHCGMVWVCPVCSAAIWGERSFEIGAVASAHVATGGVILFVTLTTRHHKGDPLAGLMDFLRAGWRGFMDGRGGHQLRERLGLVGYIRATEITYGANGWHPHFHTALFLPAGTDLEAAEIEVRAGFARWSRAVVRAGGKVPLEQVQDVRAFGRDDSAALAEYLTKTLIQPGKAGRQTQPASAGEAAASAARVGEHLGKELSQGSGKRARTFYGTVPARELLSEASFGCADSLALWHEYEQATHRLRSLSWSRGLRALYGLGDERDDQTIVDDDRGGVAIMALTEAGLTRIIGWPELVPGMMNAWEQGRHQALRNFMDTNGIGYEEITDEQAS